MTEAELVKSQRNFRVSSRYDQLMREGKHGHYETLFRIVREEIDRARPIIEANLLREMHNTEPKEDWEHPHQFVRQIARERGLEIES